MSGRGSSRRAPAVTKPAGTATKDRLAATLSKAFVASLVANLPMLALLLVPQLLRSRAGSETLLFVGSTFYCALIVIALTTAPLVSAWAAPKAEPWTTRTACGTTREIRRTQGRDFWQRVGEWFLFFVLAQAAGFFVEWLMPYVWDNPAFGPQASRGGFSATATTWPTPSPSTCSVACPSPGSARASASCASRGNQGAGPRRLRAPQRDALCMGLIASTVSAVVVLFLNLAQHLQYEGKLETEPEFRNQRQAGRHDVEPMVRPELLASHN